MNQRASDKIFTFKNIFGSILIVASLLWRFGIGEASDVVFILVFGFGCFLVSEQPLVNFVNEVLGKLRGKNDS